MLKTIERAMLGLVTRADAIANRLYTWRFNPLYQSGTIAVAMWLVLLVTGVWLLLFYRVGAPWESVSRLTGDLWLGNWVRGLHRYATDAAIVATAVHAVRMFAQARSWGARTMAWVTGGLLVVLLYLCAWTGYVMVWDTFGEQLAVAGARMADRLPVLSEPVSRAFTGERPVPSVFFFITLFAHIGVPLGMGVMFWLHVKRLQRPMLLPPRPLLWTVVGLLAAVAIARPLVMVPKANPFALPTVVPADVFVAFWLPLSSRIGGGALLALLTGAAAALLVVPAFTRRPRGARPPASTVDPDVCTGCTHCATDCPYGAIEMVPRTDARPTLVAEVNPDLCVSCGICSASCAPMGIGPAGRTGRDQLAAAREVMTTVRHGSVVALGCERGAGRFAPAIESAGAAFRPVSCAGNLHTSVIERLVRDGAGGVLVIACPPRDCWNREGPKWLAERMFQGREAELQPRVPRARVRITYAGAHESALALAAVRAFKADIAALGTAAPEPVDAGDAAVCETVPEEVLR
ncbi:MAG: hydrogenase iron-sulfur subunit [Acidobacteria bacterium]|nr:hydrogenase iron-sulfur subunit [Acidobacteriota bacterium]